MKVGVFPKITPVIRLMLKPPGGIQPKEVQKYLFSCVGREIELKGERIGQIVLAEVRMAPYPGSTEYEPRVYAIVQVDSLKEPFVRRYLPGGDRAVKPEDEVGQVAGDVHPEEG